VRFSQTWLLERYRKTGGTLPWLCLGKPDWEQTPEQIADAARRKPIGIAPHGALAERLHRQNRVRDLVALLSPIRRRAVLVGLSAHNPELIHRPRHLPRRVERTQPGNALLLLVRRSVQRTEVDVTSAEWGNLVARGGGPDLAQCKETWLRSA
jgi:hypothetical protein